MQLNLNADLGESFGPWPMGDDEGLLDVVDSANVACGFHAGDPLVMSRTVARARARGVGIGAHPGFPDLQGFGRREMRLGADELTAAVQYQIGALAAMCRVHGATLAHVKPHGALNNMACEDRALADTVAAAIRAVAPDAVLLAPALSALAEAGRDAGLAVALELFADRAYTARGTLVPRREPGAVLESTEACLAHVRAMIAAGGLVTPTGEILPTPLHSVCVHGDGLHALATARALREALIGDGHALGGLSPA